MEAQGPEDPVDVSSLAKRYVRQLDRVSEERKFVKIAEDNLARKIADLNSLELRLKNIFPNAVPLVLLTPVSGGNWLVMTRLSGTHVDFTVTTETFTIPKETK